MNINDTLQYQNYGMPDDILRRKMYGDYEGALRLIQRRLEDASTPAALKAALEVQKLLCERIPAEFPYTRAEALGIIREHIPDFTEAEFEEYIDGRQIRWIYVNGEMRIFNRFFSSLSKAVPDFSKRASVSIGGVEAASNGSAEANRLDVVMEKRKEHGSASTRIRVRASLKLKDDQFVPGMFIRAHLPIPAACPQQSEIKIEKLYPENAILAPEDAQQRTVCWEEYMQENHEFAVEYSYLHTARYTDAYHLKGADSAPGFDVQEQEPHIVFSPYLKALCGELTEGMTDPLEKAKAFYDFITCNMNYTYMPSYILLENIAETCARDFTGDCGVFALLFITLCRCAGIPAQWQSGMTVEPDFIGSHDWARFYVEPYGWLFADPSYGISAKRNGKEERRQFYFGNLDPYRMVANREFYKSFTIPKAHWRADPYDNQSGEMETSDRGFASEEYERNKEILLCQEV